VKADTLGSNSGAGNTVSVRACCAERSIRDRISGVVCGVLDGPTRGVCFCGLMGYGSTFGECRGGDGDWRLVALMRVCVRGFEFSVKARGRGGIGALVAGCGDSCLVWGTIPRCRSTGRLRSVVEAERSGFPTRSVFAARVMEGLSCVPDRLGGIVSRRTWIYPGL